MAELDITPAGSAHALLDGIQNNDTVAQTPTRGSIIYSNSTPVWDELVIGTSGQVLRSDGTDITWSTLALADISPKAHATLTSLTVDDHTQYALLAGRATGQTLIGGTASGEDLTLSSTANATKGSIFIGSSSLFEFDQTSGQLKLPTSGSGAGLLLGTDVQVYRSAANTIRLDAGVANAFMSISGTTQFFGSALTTLDFAQTTVAIYSSVLAQNYVEFTATGMNLLPDDIDLGLYVGISNDSKAGAGGSTFTGAKLQHTGGSISTAVTYTLTGYSTIIYPTFAAVVTLDYNERQSGLAAYDMIFARSFFRNSGSVGHPGFITGFRTATGFTVDGGTLTGSDAVVRIQGFWSQPTLTETSAPTALTITNISAFVTWQGIVLGTSPISATNTTVTNIRHYFASNPNVTGSGAKRLVDTGVTLTNQYGLFVDDMDLGVNRWGIFIDDIGATTFATATSAIGVDIADFTGGTLVVGVRSGITSGSGRWGFQFNTAASYHQGDLMVGAAVAASGKLHVQQGTIGNEVFRLESLATNDDPLEKVFQNRVATTNATVTTLHTYTIPASTTVHIVAYVEARRTGGSAGTAEDGAGYIIVGTIKNVAGTATIIGVVNNVVAQEDQVLWDATIDVTGATARIRVTGAVNNNITWHGTIRVLQVGT
jgi:hypothetical protein